MKRVTLLLTVCVMAGQSSAMLYDANVYPDVIFGDGNANGGFTVENIAGPSPSNGIKQGIQLGLRAKLRYNASGLPENTFNSNGDGTYTFQAVQAPGQGSDTAVWCFEWSINSNWDETVSAPGSNELDDFTYELKIDFDPDETGTNFVTFDPINVEWADHSIGDNSTPNGGGTVAADATEYANLISTKNVAQNSWQMQWFDEYLTTPQAFDPTVAGFYDIELSVFNSSGGLIGSTQITVQTVEPANVPEPMTLLAVGSAVAGLGGYIRRRKQA